MLNFVGVYGKIYTYSNWILQNNLIGYGAIAQSFQLGVRN